MGDERDRSARREPSTADPLSVFVDRHRAGLPPTRQQYRFNAGEHLWLGSRGARQACEELVQANPEVPDFSEHFVGIARRQGKDRLDYGELVALSGDFYETPEALFDEKPSALPWLWEDNDLSDLRGIFEAELGWIEDRQKGAGSTVYPDYNIRLAWNAKSYVELALRNSDHFGWHNMRTYCRAHEQALRLAVEANRLPDETFRRALYTNAFADHFLTDGFAAGHIRVPRAEIRAWGKEQGYGEQLAGALSKVIHDQDGHVDLASLHGAGDRDGAGPSEGLRVRNARGTDWTTRCDGQLFLDRGSAGSAAVQQATAAVAASVTELLLAWHFRELPPGRYRATELVPFPHPEAPPLTAKFPADMPKATLDRLLASVAWYARIPWLGPGLEEKHLRALVVALPDLMARFRASVKAEAEGDPALTARLAPAYVAAFQKVD